MLNLQNNGLLCVFRYKTGVMPDNPTKKTVAIQGLYRYNRFMVVRSGDKCHEFHSGGRVV